ncbi:MAG TPA: histidine triad nucleotide-binding protein [Actinomycetota bacterium]|nr:histidine triad nucleotide-binding protein [Actinomycetota bacterium]
MATIASDCLFCKIVEGEISADVVHTSDHVVAFRDINPQAPTHILLIPKDHIESVSAVTDEHGPLLVELMQTATHLAEAEGLTGGWRLVTNVGPDAGQSVLHLHFHLLGGRGMGWPPG